MRYKMSFAAIAVSALCLTAFPVLAEPTTNIDLTEKELSELFENIDKGEFTPPEPPSRRGGGEGRTRNREMRSQNRAERQRMRQGPERVEERGDKSERIPRIPMGRGEGPRRPGRGFGHPEQAPGARVQQFMRLFREADTNQDGTVTLEDIRAIRPNFPEEAFKRLDTNADGVISKEDFVDAIRERMGDRTMGPMGRGEGPMAPGMRPGRPEQAPGARVQQIIRLFREADTNQDGTVTLEDIRAIRPNFPEEAFKRLDTNKDGVISKEDLEFLRRPQ